jgi:hypothetical protein
MNDKSDKVATENGYHSEAETLKLLEHAIGSGVLNPPVETLFLSAAYWLRCHQAALAKVRATLAKVRAEGESDAEG